MQKPVANEKIIKSKNENWKNCRPGERLRKIRMIHKCRSDFQFVKPQTMTTQFPQMRHTTAKLIGGKLQLELDFLCANSFHK